MRTERPRLLPSAERYTQRHAAPPGVANSQLDPNTIERAALYLEAAELLPLHHRDASIARRTSSPRRSRP